MQLVATQAFSFVLIEFFVVNILRLASRFRLRCLEGKDWMLPRRAMKPNPSRILSLAEQGNKRVFTEP
jgi:hypothetical protein